MRIVVAHNYYKLRGGEDEVFEAEADLLEAAGHEVTRWTRHNDAVESHSKARLAVATIWNSEEHRALSNLCRRIRPDVIHFHNTLPLISPAAAHAAAAAGAAVVQTLHNFRLVCPTGTLYREGRICETCLPWPIALPGILRGCYRGSRIQTAGVAAMTALHRALGTWRRSIDVFITPSRFVQEKLAALLPTEKLVVKPHFVAGAPSAGYGSGGYALFVGRLSSEKGIGTLLDAWRRFAPPMPLRIVGDGPLRNDVIAATTATPTITWLGQQPYGRVLELMRDASAVVSPSHCFESFNRAVIDAYACGTPVLGSDLGATAELIEDGRTGFRFPPGDAVGLAHAVAHLQGLGEKRRALRSAARGAYEARFTAEENLRLLLAIYRRAMASTRAPDRRSNGSIDTSDGVKQSPHDSREMPEAMPAPRRTE